MQTKLKWITPNAEQLIIDMARVSSDKPEGEEGEGLLRYLIRHKHWSPFEMASACFEIHTTRDIARQILRHRSFSFQEFSQRYAQVDEGWVCREARMQDPTNRQNSIATKDGELIDDWVNLQASIYEHVSESYEMALSMGIAKEVARAILPEGLTPTRMYMVGNIRSWLHYLSLRRGNGTQLEHIKVADSIHRQLSKEIPTIMGMV